MDHTARTMTLDEATGLDDALARILAEAAPAAPPAAPAPSPGPTASPGRPAPVLRPERPATAPAQPNRPVAQGDLLFVPVPAEQLPHWAQPLAVGGVDLIPTGNGHRLLPVNDRTRFAAVHGHRHVIAIVQVDVSARIVQPRGHDAHTPLVLGAGTWAVRQQTEVVPPLMTPEQLEAGTIRRVFD